jgi:hypothetical protein
VRQAVVDETRGAAGEGSDARALTASGERADRSYAPALPPTIAAEWLKGRFFFWTTATRRTGAGA